MNIKTDGIVKVITYYNEQNEPRCYILYDNKKELDVRLSPEGELYIAKLLTDRGYTTAEQYEAIKNGTDPLISYMVSSKRKKEIEQEEKEKIAKSKSKFLGAANFQTFRRNLAFRIRRLKVNTKLFLGLAAVGALGFGGYKICRHSQNENQPNIITTIETESETENAPILDETAISMEQQASMTEEDRNALAKIAGLLLGETYNIASEVQQKFMNASMFFAQVIQEFNENHREKNVTFEDGHVEEVVEFGYSPEEFASAYILGANFNKEDFSKFMNASNINIDEYKKHYKSWFKMTYYQYLIRNSQEETGILEAASGSEEALAHVKMVDDLHKELRKAQEENNMEKQMEIVNKLYTIKNESFKIVEASQLEATYENFKSLNLPDYVLLTKPIYDSIAIQYRNTVMNDGKQFYNELDGKVFGEDGIYCHLYEWTMLENVEYQEDKISQPSFVADESYADYSAVIRAIEEAQKKLGILKDSNNKNRYAVENLESVKKALEAEYGCVKEENSNESCEGAYGVGGGSSTVTPTRTETSTRTTTTKKKVSEKDLTAKEKKEVAKQKKAIQEDLENKTETNKKNAESEAEQAAKKDQQVEDQNKEKLESEVESENKKTEEDIQDIKPGEKLPDNDNIEIESEYKDENNNLDDSVSDVTQDGTGAVDKNTPLPDPEDFYNQTHSDENTNTEENTNTNDNTNADGNVDNTIPDTSTSGGTTTPEENTNTTPSTEAPSSDQSDSIIEGEEPIQSSTVEEVPVESTTVTVDTTSSQATAESYVEQTTVPATEAISTTAEVYVAPTTQEIRQAVTEQVAAEIVEKMETEGLFDEETAQYTK